MFLLLKPRACWQRVTETLDLDSFATCFCGTCLETKCFVMLCLFRAFIATRHITWISLNIARQTSRLLRTTLHSKTHGFHWSCGTGRVCAPKCRRFNHHFLIFSAKTNATSPIIPQGSIPMIAIFFDFKKSKTGPNLVSGMARHASRSQPKRNLDLQLILSWMSLD